MGLLRQVLEAATQRSARADADSDAQYLANWAHTHAGSRRTSSRRRRSPTVTVVLVAADGEWTRAGSAANAVRGGSPEDSASRSTTCARPATRSGCETTTPGRRSCASAPEQA